MPSRIPPPTNLAGPNPQGRAPTNQPAAPRSTTTSALSQARNGAARQSMENNQGSQNSLEAARPRAGGPSRQASTVPSIPSWVGQLPSEASGYSMMVPRAPNNTAATLGPPSNAGQQSMMPPPARTARPAVTWQAPVSTVNRPATQGFPPASVMGSEAQTLVRRGAQSGTQGPVNMQWPVVQQQPAVYPQAPVVNNYNYNYNPIDNRQNITNTSHPPGRSYPFTRDECHCNE
ncbi:hypothetical protein Daus18300_007996 [Diaporthe australafricana]|uniref:Uncharacterized protein n=1 Tax=Diaporthe australafricana TaxID=127596 RepID=A0ABR3WK76_9PEZI